MSTLITGGTGFIGSHTLRQLAGKGETLVAYDLTPDHKILQAVLGEDASKVAVVQGDILDLPLMVRTAREHEIDKVIHLAYVLGAQTEQNPGLATRVNIEGTNNVFEMAGIVGARRVVWASSIAVYGPKNQGQDGIVGTDAPYDPQSVYGATKVTNEITARRYAEIYGLETIGLRFPMVYGPEVRRGRAGFLSDLAYSLLSDEGPVSTPPFDQPLNWGYVDEIADAIARALGGPSSTQHTYTLAGFEATVGQMINMVLEIVPGSKNVAVEGAVRSRLQSRFDGSAARAELGWEARVTLQEGISRIVEHYRSMPGG